MTKNKLNGKTTETPGMNGNPCFSFRGEASTGYFPVIQSEYDTLIGLTRFSLHDAFNKNLASVIIEDIGKGINV